LRELTTLRECWSVHFAKRLPVGVVECSSTVCIKVFDDTGEAELE
jgi:hypothetical protein